MMRWFVTLIQKIYDTIGRLLMRLGMCCEMTQAFIDIQRELEGISKNSRCATGVRAWVKFQEMKTTIEGRSYFLVQLVLVPNNGTSYHTIDIANFFDNSASAAILKSIYQDFLREALKKCCKKLNLELEFR